VSGADTSINSNSIANSRADQSSGSDDSRRPSDTQAPDPSELRQQGQLFRSMMDTPLTARQLASWADAGKWASADSGDVDPWAPDTRGSSDPSVTDRWTSGEGGDSRQDLADRSPNAPIDVSAMLQARHTIDAGPGLQAAAPASTTPGPSLAELIEKHVRRVLASVDAPGDNEGEVRIELSDAVFPGTELSLKRTAGGWQLTATANNRQSLDKLRQFAPALVERFAQASLGELTLVSRE
jgi:hypothetical protein